MKLMRPISQRLRRLLVSLLQLAAASALSAALAFDLLALGHFWTDEAAAERTAWLDQYGEIQRVIEKDYPNLEWTFEHTNLDLAALDDATTERIKHAASRAEAERAMRRFVRAFKDGHLSLHPAERPDPELKKLEVDVVSRHTPPANACATLGYGARLSADLPFAFQGVAAFRSFDDEYPFAAGVLSIDTHRVGIVRVPSFDESNYASACRAEWSRLRLTLDTTCEARCDAALDRAIRNRLVLKFESRVRQLEAAGVEMIALDLTENYGGYDWFQPLMRILTGSTLPMPPMSFVRGPETAAELDGRMARLERIMALCPPPPSRRAALEEDYRQLDVARIEALSPCDRGGLWLGFPLAPGCTQLTSPLVFDSEALANLDSRPGDARGLVDTVLEPARYHQPRVTWRGVLAVLVDRHTGSAAEVLAGTLQDYGGAIVIGEHSANAGAGWHRGDRPTTFRKSALELHVPDSVEYRRDGSSYRAGIEPDILTGWGPDEDAAEKGKWLVGALGQALEAKAVRK